MKSNNQSNLPFYAIIFFTFVVYISPQTLYPFLQPLHLAKTSIAIAVLVHIASALARKKPILVYDKETKVILFLVFLAFLSIPFSLWPGGSFQGVTEGYLKTAIVFILIANIITSLEQLKIMWWSIIFFCSYIAKIGIQGYFSENFLEGSNRLIGVHSSVALNPNDMALTLVLSIPFAIGLFQTSKKNVAKVLTVLYVVVAIVGVIFTRSRGGFIVLIGVLVVYFVNIFKKGKIKAIFFAAACAILFFIVMPGDYSERMATIFDPESEGSSSERKESTFKAIDIMFEHPLGVGFGQNMLALNEKGMNWTHVHNVYLEFGADLGILAMLLFIRLLMGLIKSMRLIQAHAKSSSEHAELVLFAQALRVSLIAFAISGLFYPIAYHFYFYYLAGFAVAIIRISKDHVFTPDLQPM